MSADVTDSGTFLTRMEVFMTIHEMGDEYLTGFEQDEDLHELG